MQSMHQQTTAASAVLAAESERCQALVAGDTAKMADLVADDFVYIHSNGEIDDRESYLKLFESGRLKYKRFEHQNPRVRVYGDLAIINATTDVETGGGVLLHVRSSSAWFKASDVWRQILWHATLVPPPK